MKCLTWDEFDLAVHRIAEMAQGLSLAGVCGLPRGGLPLAVALSHRLELPLLHTPQTDCLLVDDVYETGQTLEPFRGVPALTAVWVSKVTPTWWKAAQVSTDPEWLVFPWENPVNANTDQEVYHASR